MTETPLATRDDLHVVLVRPQIHWNTGNVGRSCLAAGAQLHLVRPLGFSLEDRRVRRAGLDYWPRVAPRVWPDWESLEAELPGLGPPFLFSADAARDLWSVRFPRPAVLVFGSEAEGLPRRLRAADRAREPADNLRAPAGVRPYESPRDGRAAGQMLARRP